VEQVFDYKWNKYLLDTEQSDTDIRIFVANFVISVDKLAIDAGVVANKIRVIPGVTTVSKDTFGKEERAYYKAIYHIKFVLEPHEDLNTYIIKVLKRELQKIDGIRVHSYRGSELID